MRGVTPNGPAIRSRRLREGLSQVALAKLTDLDVKTIRKAEKGQRLDIATVTSIAEALKEDVNVFVNADTPDVANSEAERNLFIAKALVEYYDEGAPIAKYPALSVYFTEDIVFHCPAERSLVPFGGDWHGAEGVQQFFDNFYAMFSRKQGGLQPEYTVSDQRVVVRLTDQVYFQGHEMKPYWVYLHFQFRDGLLCRIDDEFDQYTAQKEFEELIARLNGQA